MIKEIATRKYTIPKQCQQCLQELQREKCGDDCVSFRYKKILKREEEFERTFLDKISIHTILK